MSSTPTPFPTTRWTLVLRADDDGDALNDLLTRYWRPVYAFIRRQGADRHEAADMTQGFLSEVVIGRNLIGRVDENRGRFRSYLRTALGRYCIDAHRRKAAVRRLVELPVDPGTLDTAEPEEAEDAPQNFERMWATTVLNVTLEQMEKELRREGREDHWSVFSARILRPAIHGTQPPSMDQLAASLALGDPARASRMIYSAKRRFKATLQRVVAQTVESDSEVEDELRHVTGFLGPSLVEE